MRFNTNCFYSSPPSSSSLSLFLSLFSSSFNFEILYKALPIPLTNKEISFLQESPLLGSVNLPVNPPGGTTEFP